MLQREACIVFGWIQKLAEPVELPKDHKGHGQGLEPDAAITGLQLSQCLVGHAESLTEIRDGHPPLLACDPDVMAKAF